MTRNQQHAIELARQVATGVICPEELGDADWALMLLAAGLNGNCRPVHLVCRKILCDCDASAGYFAGTASVRQLQLASEETATMDLVFRRRSRTQAVA